MTIRSVAIIGLGLLGGSIGLAVRARAPHIATTGWDRDPAVRDRLKHAVGTDFHGTHAVLHPSQDLALSQGQHHDREHDHAHDRGDLRE